MTNNLRDEMVKLFDESENKYYYQCCKCWKTYWKRPTKHTCVLKKESEGNERN